MANAKNIEIGAKQPSEEAATPVSDNPDLLKVDENGLATAKLSDRRTVKIKELNGLESLNVTRLLPPLAGSSLALHYQALASIRQIDDVPYAMVRELMEIDALAARLSAKELDKLVNVYTMTFYLDEGQREQLKNS